MESRCIWLVGAVGLMGDVLEHALGRLAAIVRVDELDDLSGLNADRSPEIVIVHGTGRTLANITQTMRANLNGDSLVIVVDDDDPSSFLFRAHDPVIWRQPIALTDVIDIAVRGLAHGGQAFTSEMFRSRGASTTRQTVQEEVV